MFAYLAINVEGHPRRTYPPMYPHPIWHRATVCCVFVFCETFWNMPLLPPEILETTKATGCFAHALESATNPEWVCVKVFNLYFSSRCHRCKQNGTNLLPRVVVTIRCCYFPPDKCCPACFRSACSRSRIAENPAAFTFLVPGDGRSIAEHVAAILSLGGTAYLAYCLALPRGYLLGAYTAGAYLLGGSRRWVDSRQVQSVGPSSPITALGRFRLHAWPTVSTNICQDKVKNRKACVRVHLRLAWRYATGAVSCLLSSDPNRCCQLLHPFLPCASACSCPVWTCGAADHISWGNSV